MKSWLSKIKHNLIYLLPLFLLFIFIFSIIDRNFYIGGDMIFPLTPKNNILKSIFVWEETGNGMNFFKYMIILWQLVFYFFSLLGIPSDISIKIFIVLMYIQAYFFCLLLWKKLFKKTDLNNKIFANTFSLFFLLTPVTAIVFPGAYQFFCLPGSLYFLLAFLENNNYLQLMAFSFFFSFGCFSDLPQAKYLIIYFFVHLFFLTIYLSIKKLNLLRLMFQLSKTMVITFLLNAFLLLPFINNVFSNYSLVNDLKNVSVYEAKAGLYALSLPFTLRFTDGYVQLAKVGTIGTTHFLVLWGFFLWTIILKTAISIKHKTKQKNLVRIFYLSLFFLTFFIFWAKGSNPPFQRIYQYLVNNFLIFKFFRTTTHIFIAVPLFFSLLMTISLFFLYQKSKKIFLLILLINLFAFRFIYLGHKLFFYKEGKPIQKGISIPEEYFSVAKLLDSDKNDFKVVSLPFDDGYDYKDWGYSGFPLFPWLTKKPMINTASGSVKQQEQNLMVRNLSGEEACFWLASQNIGYVIEKKDSIDQFSFADFKAPLTAIFEGENLSLKKVNEQCFLPRIYTADSLVLHQGNAAGFYEPKNLLNNSQQPLIFDNKISLPDELSARANKIVEIKFSKEDFDTESFSFNKEVVIPKKATYKLIIKDDGETTDILLGDKPIKNGDKVILEDKEYTFTAIIQESKNLLVDDKWFDSEKGDDFSKLEPPSLTIANPVIFQKIVDWQRNSDYILKIEYDIAQDDYIDLLIDERKEIIHGRQPSFNSKTTLLTERIYGRQGEQRYFKLINSDIDALSANIYFAALTDKEKIISQQLSKVAFPRLYLILETSFLSQPLSITTIKSNSTSYKVDVKGARNDYFLVFSDNYDDRWQVYVGNKKVPDGRHFKANTFANAWWIKPEDAGYKENYSLQIEYLPQRLFITGVIISLATVFFIYYSLFFHFLKRRRKIAKHERNQY